MESIPTCLGITNHESDDCEMNEFELNHTCRSRKRERHQVAWQRRRRGEQGRIQREEKLRLRGKQRRASIERWKVCEWKRKEGWPISPIYLTILSITSLLPLSPIPIPILHASYYILSMLPLTPPPPQLSTTTAPFSSDLHLEV